MNITFKPLPQFTNQQIDRVLSKLYYKKEGISPQVLILELNMSANNNNNEALKLEMVKKTRLANITDLGFLIISERGNHIMSVYGSWIEYLEHEKHLKRVKNLEYYGLWVIFIGGLYYLLEILKIIFSWIYPCCHQ